MAGNLTGHWVQVQRGLRTRTFHCGRCDALVASLDGWSSRAQGGAVVAGVTIRVCPNCNRPSFFEGSAQMPGVAFGGSIPHLPSEVDGLYNEARKSTSNAAYTPAVMAARKLLMNVAVDKGAAEGLSFQKYGDYLFDNGYLPPDSKNWVDKIRKRGNDANHKIIPMDRGDAELVLGSVEMLLRFIYEFPSKAKQLRKNTNL